MRFPITIFTSTLNRAYIISILYDSLCNQTFQDFEWVIVNDGSKDNTNELIQEWIKEQKIKNIVYIQRPNPGGIADAINQALEVSKGHLFMKVDDDDFLIPEAIEIIIRWEKSIADKQGYAGVSGLRFYPNGESVGGSWKAKTNYVDATNFERKKFKLLGDKAEVYYTDILKKMNPFPFFEGETYAFEGILWDQIAQAGYKIRWFNEKIYCAEYLPDGQTRNHFLKCRENFLAYSFYANRFKEYEKIPLNERIMFLSKYFAVAFSKRLTKKSLPNFFIWNRKWLYLSYVAGYFIYQLRLLLKGKKYKVENI